MTHYRALDKKGLFVLFLNKNLCCDHSLELSLRDGSNELSQHRFLWKNKEISLNYPWYPFLSIALIVRISKRYIMVCSPVIPGDNPQAWWVD